MNPLRDEISRRCFLQRYSKTFLGVSVLGLATSPRAAENPAPRARSVIYIYLRGGLSHIDTFDPKPGRPEMGGVRAIPTRADGVQISEWLPLFANQMRHVALVRSMTSTQGVHDRGNYLAHTSYFMTPTISHPAHGAWALRRLGSINPLLPGNVLINGSSQHPGSGYMPAHLAPLPIPDPAAGLQNSALPERVTEADFVRRTQLAQALGDDFLARTPHPSAAAYRKVHEEAVSLMRSRDLGAFDISQESRRTQEQYGSHTFGKGCLLARRLVEHGVRFIEVEEGQNWDTHNDHLVAMRRMTPSLDQTLSALIGDLHDCGLLASTLVVLATEFGRSPQISETTEGRGHHPSAFTWWLAGGGIKGGVVHGKSDEAGHNVAENSVTMPDFNATIARALGIDLDHIERSPSGRPFTVANSGRPLESLFA